MIYSPNKIIYKNLTFIYLQILMIKKTVDVYVTYFKNELSERIIYCIIKLCKIALFSLTINFCNNSSSGSTPSRAA